MITNQLLSWMIFQYRRDSDKLSYVAVGQIDYARASSCRLAPKALRELILRGILYIHTERGTF